MRGGRKEDKQTTYWLPNTNQPVVSTTVSQRQQQCQPSQHYLTAPPVTAAVSTTSNPVAALCPDSLLIPQGVLESLPTSTFTTLPTRCFSLCRSFIKWIVYAIASLSRQVPGYYLLPQYTLVMELGCRVIWWSEWR